MRFSSNIASLQPSATLALAARARALRDEGRSVVDLSAGEPTFETPAYAAEAGIRAIRQGRTGYPPTAGIPELRRAAADYLGETTAHAGVGEEHVLVSAGVKQALFNCLFCLAGPGDEVLVPAPYWPSYPALVELTGAHPVVVETTWEGGFLLEPEALEAARTERTRGLLLNSPGNPTGVVYPLELVERIAAWCGAHDLWILSDEIYRRLHYVNPGPAPSLFDVADRPAGSVVLDGVSKAFCMTGWRIGFAAGPSELIFRATALQSHTTSGAVTPSQHAAAAALGRSEEREASVEGLLERLRRTRSMALAALASLEGVELRPPPGAIYLYLRLVGGASSMEVAERLLVDGGVAGIPGEAFGSPGHLRFNFAVTEEIMAEGVERIRRFFASSAS